MKNNQGNNGFTLIELLVVVTIISILTYLITFSAGNFGNANILKNEAKRFYSVLRIASEEAIFQKKEIGLVVDSKSYHFVELNEETNKWERINSKLFKSYSLPENIEIYAESEGRRISYKFSKGRPAVLFLSSGEITPFKIKLNSSKDFFILEKGESGEIVLAHET